MGAAAKAQLQHKVHKARNLLTKSNWFQGKVKEVWEACDANGTGSLNKDELYTGIIFLHLKLAEKAGAAACHPPTRAVSDAIFDAADADRSGQIDHDEFVQIVGIVCKQLLKRMVVVVPVIAIQLVRLVGTKIHLPGPFAEKIAEHVTTGYIFTQVVPYFWNKIDATAHQNITDQTTAAAAKNKQQ